MLEKKPYKRSRNLFNPQSKSPFRLSRSRLENFIKCPRCFYLDRRLGIDHPSMPAFTLNSTVDELLKKEFDFYRREQTPHPLMQKYRIDAVPFLHRNMDQWRENFKGIRYEDTKRNLIIFGAIDDLWVNPKGELFVVDYKATSATGTISLNSEYRQAYKRQMEIYQWLLRKQNLDVSNTGYFVYCNANKNRKSFDGHLDFDVEVLGYIGDDAWVDGVIQSAYDCLCNDHLPEFSETCEFCQYYKSIDDFKNQKVYRKEEQQFLF
ncbi:MAG: PD-(D/E)XK nuclease family protein [Candidatus Omnitrophica bacterium]|nr:PD-(D/E)XK nuclease family protein [Candidatus Omnitrophota bacterium]